MGMFRSTFSTILRLGWISLSLANATEKEEKRANRLKEEKSPYLLLHAHNPVDWFPWGEEAFEKAKTEKKLILLSVGYSTCHWCHVMERESFENEKIAAFLNEHFVSIKLDREERPDVDQVYLTAFQAMTQQSGGWPLNMFLTPDLKPLTGGTYFPPEDKLGQAGFLSVLQQVQGIWSENREELLAQSVEMHRRIGAYFKERHSGRTEQVELKKSLLEYAVQGALAELDPVWGGVGTELKFPQASVFRFLLQSGGEEGRKAILKTCRRMMNGGIHDQVAGGFHRYAVDREWLIPHFEKMLYDQAQLLELYLDAWLISGELAFREVAQGIADYVLRDLTHPEGGFYCAQDAQSEGKEGKYFCWTVAELAELLSDQELALAREVLGVSDEGNFIDYSDPEALKNQNVLHFKKAKESLEKDEKIKIQGVLSKLAQHREKRVPPAVDDKILASWNGLMIGAMARAGRVLENPRYLGAARKAHRFVKSKLWDEKKGQLYHRWRDGERDGTLQAESYLMFLAGTRKLYEAELKGEDLVFALKLAEGAKRLFYDEMNGGFFQGEQREDLVLRLKGQFDSAIPTESSLAAREFAILSALTGREDLREISKQTLRSYEKVMRESPASMGEMLMSLSFFLDRPAKLVIAGVEGAEEMLIEAAKNFERHRLLSGTEGPVSEFSASLPAQDGKATAYFCLGSECQLPVDEPADLKALLLRMRAESR